MSQKVDWAKYALEKEKQLMNQVLNLFIYN